MDMKKAMARIEGLQDYLVDMLSKIIAVDTSVPPGLNYDKLIDIVEPEFQALGFETKRVVMPQELVEQIPEKLEGDRVNLVASLKNGKPKVSLYAHMDVVPAESDWTMDPFTPVVKDGKLYGRGAVDMKYAIACMLGAAKAMKALGLEPNYEMDCLLCTDEEVGVYPGARYLAEQGYFSPHMMWLELGALEPIFLLGTAGAARIDITGMGKSCHSGSNYLGINAFEEMMPIINELLALRDEVQARRSDIPAFPLPDIPAEVMTPMFSMTVMRSGNKDNMVPGEARLTINRRYLPEEKYEDVVEEIRQAVERGRARSKLLDVKFQAANAFYPVAIDSGSPAAQKQRQALKDVLGYDGLIEGGLSASTDLGFVLEAMGGEKFDIATFGNVRLATMTAHAADEHCNVRDLVELTKLMVHYLCF